jgi:hypothetical protein
MTVLTNGKNSITTISYGTKSGFFRFLYMTHPPSKASAGTSLFEALFLVLISGLLLSLSYPTASQIRYNGLRQEARNLKAGLETLKLLAGIKEETLILSLEPDHYSASSQREPGKLLLSRRLPHGLSVEFDESLQPRQLTFYPSGVASPRTLQLTNGDSKCILIVSLRGRVSLRC